MPATYNRMQELLYNIRNDLAILSGDIIGLSDASWQGVAGTCAINLNALASQLEQASKGDCEHPIAFPSLETVDDDMADLADQVGDEEIA